MSIESQWVSEKQVSEVLRIEQKNLEVLREMGFLKPGTHWKSSLDPKQLPWCPKVLYNIRCCKEFIEHWDKHDYSFSKIAA